VFFPLLFFRCLLPWQQKSLACSLRLRRLMCGEGYASP
jgi:hypothetical protein